MTERVPAHSANRQPVTGVERGGTPLSRVVRKALPMLLIMGAGTLLVFTVPFLSVPWLIGSAMIAAPSLYGTVSHAAGKAQSEQNQQFLMGQVYENGYLKGSLDTSRRTAPEGEVVSK